MLHKFEEKCDGYIHTCIKCTCVTDFAQFEGRDCVSCDARMEVYYCIKICTQHVMWRHKIVQRITLHLHTLQQTDNVGCRYIESCEYHRFFIVTSMVDVPDVVIIPLSRPAKGIYFVPCVICFVRTSLFFLITVRFTSLLRRLFTVERNDKIIIIIIVIIYITNCNWVVNRWQ